MEIELLRARVEAFLYEAGSMLLTALATVIFSQDFRDLVTEHFGQTFLAGLLLLALSAGAKHWRNKQVLKDQLGATHTKPVTLI